MKKISRALVLMSCLVFTMSGWAQETAPDMPAAKKPDITAEQVLEKYIEVTGGREPREKITSSVVKGTIEVVAQGIRGTLEVYAKAPNKLLVVQAIPGIGEINQGYDTQTFLLLRGDGVNEGPHGSIPVEICFSDYREVDGVKSPFQLTQKSPVGEAVIKITDVKNNVEIDDAKFAKPGASGK